MIKKPIRKFMDALHARVINRRLALQLLVFASVVPTANAQEAMNPPANASPNSAPVVAGENEVRHILEHMQDADLNAVFDVYQANKDPVIHAIAAMAIERIRFNLDAATHDAKICADSLIDDKPGFALLCAEFQIGNLRLANRAQAANELLAKTIERFRNHHLDNRLATLQKTLDTDTNTPVFSIDPIATDVEIKLKREKTEFGRTRDLTSPTFEAKANGESVDLTLDTGATDFVLSQNYADRFGVKALDRKGKANGWLTKDVPVQRGILDALQIGPITLHNVPVRVIPTRETALLGANLVASLGTLRITHDSIKILGEHSVAPTCDRPMQIGSDVSGRYFRIIPTFAINDAPQSVMLDTGASSFLIGSKAAVDEVKKLRSGFVGVRDIGGDHRFADAEAAKVKLTIDNQPFLVYFIVYTESEMKYAITLGGNALSKMDFILDFRHQHLCFPMHPLH